MGHVKILANMFFADITGSATADVAALGPIEIAMMKDAGYRVDYSAAITAASPRLAPLFPRASPWLYTPLQRATSPSAASSSPALFRASSLGTMVYHYSLSVRKNYPYRGTPIGFREFLHAFKEAILAPLMPAIILFGVLGGVFTATEASAVAVAYALIVGFFVTKQLSFEKLRRALLQSGLTTGMALFLIATANIFSWILATQQVPQLATNFFLSTSKSPYIYLLLVNLLLFGVGCLMDNLAALITFTPILAPIAAMLGINPIHFGIVVSINLVIGLLTPPVGLCLFMACTIAKIRLEEIVRKIWPFLLIEIGVLMLITCIPDLILTVPRLFGYVR